ncbi:MAG: thioesterase II family protein [Pseudomonas sp.]|uniref:thioesterase II family protein n=1 Tax=unclassified Pseudomonas TaxID=196821 RepID=UPI00072FC85C|nr:alpha/beta fold hydrolase [Pseudomonas sp. L5B5]KTC38251.1 thioesterase [Pseudomonas sp. ABAC61]UCZ82356.1 alpha/beta fold hydrolase [Pseudomonas sp. L5B5]
MDTDNREWTLVINSGQAPQIRLICFPHAGAAAEPLRVWSTGLADHIELVLVNLPGHGPRRHETPCDNWPSLLEKTFAALAPWLKEPHALFGHGLGALLAYEAAKYAQERFPRQTRHLFVSGCRSPDSLPHHPLLHTLPTAAFREAILTLGGSPLEIPRGQGDLQAYEHLLRTGLKLFETWYDTSSGCLNVPLTAFYGSEDPLATAGHMLNWREFTTREFELIEVLGNHFFIKSQRQRLLQVINTHLGLLGEPLG